MKIHVTITAGELEFFGVTFCAGTQFTVER